MNLPRACCAVDRIIAFAGGKQSRNVRPLLEVDPKAAHRIMHARENSHRHIPRVVTDEHFIDLKDSAQFSSKRFGRNMREIEIYLIFAADTHTLKTDLKYLARSDVAR